MFSGRNQSLTKGMKRTVRSMKERIMSRQERIQLVKEEKDPIKERNVTHQRKDPFKSDGLMKDLNIIESKINYLLHPSDYHTSTENLFLGNPAQCPCCSMEVSGGYSDFGKTFHKECFKCIIPTVKVGVQLFAVEDKPFCEMCYKVSKDVFNIICET